jgi:hypothetical protein
MRIGFTGTRYGMSVAQEVQLRHMLGTFRTSDQATGMRSEFHYGTHESVVLESDAEAASIAEEMGYRLVAHHAHPGGELDRNRREVDAVHILIAAPETDKETQRSGTWATVRYARSRGMVVVMLSRHEP